MRPPPPLRRTLALRFALAGLVPILAAGLLIFRHLAVETVNDIGKRNLLLARAVRGQVDGYLREPVVVLEGLREQLLSHPGAPSDVGSQLAAAVRSSPLLESIFLIGPDGRVRQAGFGAGSRAHLPDYIGLDLGHQPFVQQALATGRPSWSGTFLSILSGRVSLAVCLPAGQDVLLGSFEVARLLEFTRRLPEGGTLRVSIIDRGGSVIAHPDPQVALRQIKVGHLDLVRRGLAGEELTARGEVLGLDTISSVVRTPQTGWLVLVSQDARAAYREVFVAGTILLGALLATVGMAVLFALTQSRSIAGPLAKFAGQARTVAAGGYGFTPPRSGTLEVRELGESFLQMTEAVRKREQLLRESEEKYRLLIEHAGDAIFVAQDGRMPFFNRRVEELSGKDAETLRGAGWTDLLDPEDRERIAQLDRAILAGDPAPPTAVCRFVRPGGDLRWAQMNSVRLLWEGRPATLNFVRDITELKTLEAQALQAQKMEAVGTLAGGIAHDFNNLLQAIHGSAELALMPGRNPLANRRVIEQILAAAERGADLTRQLLTFSRNVESRRRPVDLNEVIRQVLQMLAHTVPKMVRIAHEEAEGLPAIAADPVQVQQVLMNLALNAVQAMPGGGTLRIATSRADLAGRDERRPEILPGRYVAITVSDTGLGIEERHQSRIFEPFFTTKGPGEGTGLGLAMAYGIVKAHEGHLSVVSRVGEGTAFTVLLPSLESAAPEPAAERPPEEPPPELGPGRCILVVDDEDVVRGVGAEILSGLGYCVLTAPDGETALRLYREQPGRVAVVLLDLIMPGMGGQACLRELLRVDPGASVIVTSGYSADGPGDTMIAAGARGFVAKPFRVQTLLAAIRSAVAGPA